KRKHHSRRQTRCPRKRTERVAHTLSGDVESLRPPPANRHVTVDRLQLPAIVPHVAEPALRFRLRIRSRAPTFHQLRDRALEMVCELLRDIMPDTTQLQHPPDPPHATASCACTIRDTAAAYRVHRLISSPSCRRPAVVSE